MSLGVAGLAYVLWLAQQAPPAGAYETVVTAPAPPVLDGVSATSVAGAQVTAGAVGDLGRTLENAPGVARVAPAADGLVLWGATPQESRVLLDGVEIPTLFHLGGWRSVLPSEALRDASLRPGAFSADLGRAIGGIVDVRSAEPDGDAHHAWLAADLLDTSVGASGPLGGRASFLVTGRVGYLDRLQGALTSPESRALMIMPAYRDALAKINFDLGVGSKLTVEAFAASDKRRLAIDTQSPIDTLTDDRGRSFARVLVRFQHSDEGGTSSALAFAGVDKSDLDQQLGLVPVSLHAQTLLAGTRLMHGVLVGQQWLEIGLDGLVGVSSLDRRGSRDAPPREGDVSIFGASPGGATGADSWHPVLGEIAPYALAELHRGRFVFRPGIRLGDALISSDRTLPPTGLTPRVGFSRTAWTIEPRLALDVTVLPWLFLGAAGGLHHQLPDATDLSPVFGSPSLGESRGADAVASFWVRLRRASLSGAAFVRELDDLVTRNPDAQPALAQSLVQTGRGRSYGVQGSLAMDCASAGACAMLSYTLSRALRRGPSDQAWRLLDYDQTHVVAALAGYRTRHWFAGARLRYATGMPRTPVVGATYDSAAGEYRPVPGAQNSARLPAFAQLDLCVQGTWQRGRLRSSVSLDVLNATGRDNPEEIVYSGNYGRHAYLGGLPLLAVLGFRLEI